MFDLRNITEIDTAIDTDVDTNIDTDIDTDVHRPQNLRLWPRQHVCLVKF